MGIPVLNEFPFPIRCFSLRLQRTTRTKCIFQAISIADLDS